MYEPLKQNPAMNGWNIKPCWIWSLLSRLIPATKHDIEKLMSKVSEYAEKMDVHHEAQDVELTAIGTAVEGLTADVTFIKAELERINNSPGQISTEDQASLDRLLARAAAMTTKLTDSKSRLSALDSLTPPNAPTE